MVEDPEKLRCGDVNSLWTTSDAYSLVEKRTARRTPFGITAAESATAVCAGLMSLLTNNLGVYRKDEQV